MRPHFRPVLDEVFRTWSHIAIMRTLMYEKDPLSGRQIAQLAHMTHRASLLALNRLDRLGIVQTVKREKRVKYSLNRTHYFVRHGLVGLLELEDRFFPQATKSIKKAFAGHASSVIAFGPAVRKRSEFEVNLELCILVVDDEHRIQIMPLVRRSMVEMRQRFGYHMSPTVMTESDFARRFRRGEYPMQNIAKEGIILVGKRFTDLVGKN